MRKNRNKILLSSFILATFSLALFLRIYKIWDNLIFVYDQGRDAQVIQNILKGKLTLIGPTTGIPGLFLGPFYYYLIAPFYWLGAGNPLVPTIFLISLAVLGIFVCGIFSWKISTKKAAIFSAFLLAVNYGHIFYSRWLSNPNPILLLSSLYFLTVYLWITKSTMFKAGLAGFLLGLCLQTQFANAIFFIPVTILLFVFYYKKFKISEILLFLCLFLIALSPLILFNLRHDFIMITAFKQFFSKSSEKIPLLNVFKTRPIFYFKNLTFFITPKTPILFGVLAILIIIYLLQKKFWKNSGLVILTLWFFIPLLLALFYQSNKGVMWDYYLISQPIPFLMLLSCCLNDLAMKFKSFGLPLIVLFLSFFTVVNIKEWQIYQSPESNGTSLGTRIKAIDKVYQAAGSRPFDVEIFVANLQPNGYYYLFEWYGAKKYGFVPKFENSREKLLFFIMEPGQKYHKEEQKWRILWYDKYKKLGKIVETYKIGDVDIQTRERQDE